MHELGIDPLIINESIHKMFCCMSGHLQVKSKEDGDKETSCAAEMISHWLMSLHQNNTAIKLIIYIQWPFINTIANEGAPFYCH